jgi:hypothetical protein
MVRQKGQQLLTGPGPKNLFRIAMADSGKLSEAISAGFFNRTYGKVGTVMRRIPVFWFGGCVFATLVFFRTCPPGSPP